MSRWRRRARAGAAAALALAAALPPRHPHPAGGPPTLETLFRWRAPVSAEESSAQSPGRLARLFLPATVLTATRSDLSDLRLLDAQGREVPFAIDRDAGLRRRAGELETAPAAIRSANQSRSQLQETVTRWSESYELAPPPDGWSRRAGREGRTRLFLRVVSRSPRFVKRLRAETAGGEPVELLAAESLFRLPDPLRERVRFELPGGAGALRVELEGEDGGWLEPTFAWERETELAGQPEPSTVDLALPELGRSQQGPETVLTLERPRGAAPLAIVFETTTPLFRRSVSVLDSGPEVARRLLLDGEIRRVGPDEEALVMSWPPGARPAGGQLEVRVLDRDSPPLAGLEIALRLARPALLFAAGARPAHLVWGGGRVRAPRYDVAKLVPALPASGEQAEIARAVLDELALVDAALGAEEENPRFDPVSPLEFAMAPGRGLDPRAFSHARSLTAPASAHGLYRLSLSAADQAVLRADLGDLRIVDSQDRQRPYLLVADSGRERVPAAIRTSHPDGETLLSLEPSSSPLTVTAILLEIDDPFFERTYAVEAQLDGPGEPEVLARGVLRREGGAVEPATARALELALPGRRMRSLAVRIADGSDRPLQVRRAELEVPAPEVLFPAPPGAYVALLGEPDLEPPRYELESIRALVQAIDSTGVESGLLGPNEEFRLSARLRRGSSLERTILGVALATAVLVLIIVTLRLAGPRPSADPVPNSTASGTAQGGDQGPGPEGSDGAGS